MILKYLSNDLLTFLSKIKINYKESLIYFVIVVKMWILMGHQTQDFSIKENYAVSEVYIFIISPIFLQYT